MKKGFVILAVIFALCLYVTPAAAETITLAWDANTEADLKGYYVLYGPSSGNYTVKSAIVLKPATQVTLDSPDLVGTVYFVATATDTDDNESAYSEEINHTFATKGPLQDPEKIKKKLPPAE